ncbi:MAG: hypothetical protein JWP47_1087 [Polaromonas sp.]|nr:hypothetical protein [Polaromonas sp.]
MRDTYAIMTLSLAELSAAYRACLDEAIRQSPLIIERWNSDLSRLLQDKAMATPVSSEKTSLRNAVVALKAHQQQVARLFVADLTQAIADDGKTGSHQKSMGSRSLSSVSFDDLELMGDHQVQETLDGARLQQTLLQSSEFELAGFSARLSRARGFQKVQADKNPLRPEVIAGSLLKAFRKSHIDRALQSQLLVHGALLMAGQLQTLYLALTDLLVARGVAPASYGVVTSGGSSGRGSFDSPGIDISENKRPEALASVSRAKPGEWSGLGSGRHFTGTADDTGTRADQLLTLDRLHRLMAGEYDDSFLPQVQATAGPDIDDDLPQHGFSHTVPAAMDMLKELNHQGLVLRQKKTAWSPPSAPVALIRAHLKTDAKSLGQSVAIEVVGLMIEQLTHDDRLLAPVKEIIANAEPAFLRLAVTDPRFFSDRNHPARRLLDVITTKSLAYSSEEAHGFAGFMVDLHNIAQLLTEEHASDAQHFMELLQDFEQRQMMRSHAADDAHARAVGALVRAEERNILAGKIAAEIRTRPDFTTGNAVVAGFLTGPWSQVMAREWLDDETRGAHAEAAVFSMSLDDVLASFNAVDASDAARHRAWLIKAVPQLMETLRQGLMTIDYPVLDASELFEQLARMHRSALSVPQADSASPADHATQAVPQAAGAEATTRRAALEKAFAAGDSRENYHWLAPSEALQSGFINFDVTNVTAVTAASDGHTDFEETLPHNRDVQVTVGARPAGQVETPATTSAAVSLKIGDWVELLSDMRWLRAQLTWISPQQTLFMFAGESGRSHSMTSRVLGHLLELNLVKVVSQNNVLDGALNSVAATAIRNSVDSPAGW